ncbi:glycosyl transferase [Halobacteriales archaeon QS_3_64_16]|nr:MAG: glycosyl transferase [Halobacteriales archaeon QS_3_64_16]
MAPPTSVLLPTVAWTPACREVAAQLGPEDELLLICDTDADPIASRETDLPEQVRLLRAGDPEGCSGKANAIATGMSQASHDRIVWTDDDFYHPSDWLAGLHADYAVHGPVAELPFFLGRDPLSLLCEPLYALGGTLGVYAAGKAWGGAVIFERGDLDWEDFLADLSRTVSDDGLLAEYLDVTPRRRVRSVPIGGTIAESVERHVRFTQIARRHDPRTTLLTSVVMSLFTLLCLLFPLPGFFLTTGILAVVYTVFGVRRWTVLLAYPATIVQLPLFGYALARRTFVWGGRRYRWRTKFDVRVLDEEVSS